MTGLLENEAVFGFIGVIAGAVLTGGIRVFVEWRDRRNESRTAARVMYSELEQANAMFEGAIDGQPPDLLRDTRYLENASETWIEKREAIGRASSLQSFQFIAKAVRNIDDAIFLWSDHKNLKPGALKYHATQCAEYVAMASLICHEEGISFRDRFRESTKSTTQRHHERFADAHFRSQALEPFEGGRVDTSEPPAPTPEQAPV